VTSGVDYEGRKKILELVRSYCEECGAAALVATHDIAEI
jgi:ABC-type multidrug transport system ATPase subunit